MPIVKCKNCGVDLVIDEPNGVAYITYEDGSISCNKPTAEDIPPTEEQPSTEGV
jgi:hypothetical protein